MQPGIKALRQLNSTHHVRQTSLQSVFIVLALVTLACGFAGVASRPASDQATGLTPLPSLTRTRLPTLTPTANSNSTAVAVAAEANDAVSTLAPGPVTTEVTPDALIATPTPLPSFTSIPSTAANTSASGLPVPSTDASPTSPADTPTSAAIATATETPTPTSTATATATEVPTPTSTPTVTATAIPNIETPGWALAGIRLFKDQDEDRVMVYGDLINNTGSAQKLTLITGTFYNAQDQVIAGTDSIIDYWPIDIVPSGGQMPFELTILGIQSVVNFDLSVEATPSSQTLHQDFEFSGLDQWTEESGDYCVGGDVRNSGDALQEYLLVVAILYDGQDKVINFGREGGPPPSLVGDDTLSFVICDQILNQEVARYELRAWGR